MACTGVSWLTLVCHQHRASPYTRGQYMTGHNTESGHVLLCHCQWLLGNVKIHGFGGFVCFLRFYSQSSIIFSANCEFDHLLLWLGLINILSSVSPLICVLEETINQGPVYWAVHIHEIECRISLIIGYLTLVKYLLVKYEVVSCTSTLWQHLNVIRQGSIYPLPSEAVTLGKHGDVGHGPALHRSAMSRLVPWARRMQRRNLCVSWIWYITCFKMRINFF